jgi:flagellar assembly factor FliW
MYMSEYAAPLSSSLPPDMVGHKIVTTRFGDITVDLNDLIDFPRGLLGMPDRQRYVVSVFPENKMPQFQLLQSLDDYTLSFIILPLAFDNPIINREDLVIAAQDVGIALADAQMALVVSVYRSPETLRITVNARAPLVINKAQKQGIQYVFPHSRYKVQHVIKG